MTTTKTAPPRKASPGHKDAKDAIALLKADHVAVGKLFDAYAKTRSVSDKRALVAEICTALRVHAQIEEEIFYPAVKDMLKDKQPVPEAGVEHGGMKDLIAQLQGTEPDGERVDAQIKVLSAYVKRHVKQAQDGMFPMVEASSLDLVDLGARMAARKQDLLAHAA